MELVRPELLLLVPVVWVGLLLSRRWRSVGAALRFSDRLVLEGVGRGRRTRTRWIPTVLRGLALSAMIVALAQPRVAHERREIEGEGIDIAMALDISGSMKALDFEPDDRLTVAKRTIEEFVDARPHDRIALVVFAARSFTQCPLTLDHGVLKRFLDEVQIGLVEDGTAIGLGVATGVKRLARSDAESKILVLLTDGVNNVTTVDPMTAAQAARSLGVKVYTIGVGKEGLAPFPVDHPLGGRRYTHIETHIDEELLRDISELTGGQYFRAESGESLQRIFDVIDELETSRIETTVYTDYQQLAAPWMWLALALLFLDSLLGATIHRVLP